MKAHDSYKDGKSALMAYFTGFSQTGLYLSVRVIPGMRLCVSVK